MTQVPKEFRYFDRKDRPMVRAVRAATRVALGFDPAPSDEVARTFGEMYFDADPLAEAFVDEVYVGRGMREGRAMLDAALARGVPADAPESLRALFSDLDTAPSWLDRDAVERGARAFRRYGSAVFRFAGAITLAAYSESSVAKPLALSGAYTGDSTRHRFLETAAFWIAVSEPGGLEPGAPGRASALRVRIMHVFVRRRLAAHPEWRSEDWGVPISQADALLTLMGGSFAPGLAMRAMGFRPTADEIEAMMHFWRWVGHLMGVRPRWYPSSLREAAQLSFVAALKNSGTAGEDGKRLCRSYAEAFSAEAGSLEARIDDGVHRGFTNFFLPAAVRRRNGVPDAGLWGLVPALGFPVVFTAETLRRRFPALEPVADRVARAERSRWLARRTGGKAAEYRPPATLTR